MPNESPSQEISSAEHAADTSPLPPAYFLSLTVENIRCFKAPVTLDLSDGQGRPAHWTILLGDNGVGKTTLLQCLAGMRPAERKLPAPDNIVFLPYAYEHWWLSETLDLVNSAATEGKIVCQMISGATLQEALHKKTNLSDTFFFHFGKDRMQTSKISRSFRDLECYGYGAMRRRGEGSLLESRPRDACATLFDDTATLTDAEQWLLQADYTAAKTNQTAARKRRDSVIEVLLALLPEVCAIKVRQPEGLSRPPQVQAQMEYGWVPLRALSSGYRTVTAWMVDLASRMFDRYPEAKNPLEEPAVVLVDQIDLHLHPRWQRELIDQLSRIFKNTQFIVTAHSPLIVQAGAAVGANVVVLRREGDHVTINNSPTDVRGWRLDQIVSSDLFDEQPSRDVRTDKLLQERRKLLAKTKRTATDKKKLAQLEQQIGPLPTGESREDIEAMALIRRAAEKLRRRQGSKESETAHATAGA